MNARQEAHLVALHRAGEHSSAELGDPFGVGRSTVYRAIERDTRRREQGPAVGSYRDEGREPPIGGGRVEQITIDVAAA